MRNNRCFGLQNPRDLPYPCALVIVKLGGMDQQPPQERQDAEAPTETSRPKHDLGHKRLFSHRRMVADLLRLLPDDLTEGLDLGTLRRLPAEHVGDALRGRSSDMPWRIDLLPPDRPPSTGKGAQQLGDKGSVARGYGNTAGVAGRGAQQLGDEGTAPPAPASSRTQALEDPGTCLVLMEFQSTVDPRMAERMQEYAAMLRNDLAREGKVRGPGGGPPPLLPLVVYNGRRPWTAPLDLGGGTEGLPKGLAAMQPKFEYVLLEVRRFNAGTLALGLQDSTPGVNFALAQFALENASAEGLPAAMDAVARQLKAEDKRDLAESFGMWIEGVLEPRLDVRLPSMTELMEEPPMLAETLDEWAEEKFRQGRKEGLQRGIERGLQQGRAEGMAHGRAEGMERGRVEGMAHGRAEGLERERALLLRQAQRRFGADVAVALSKLIKGVEDPDRLAEVGDWIVDCATGGELLKRAGDA